MELRNVTRYYPDEMPYGENVQYFVSEDGKDFYESLELFTKKYKLCVDSEKKVASVSADVSRLYPAGFTVVEVDDLPDDFDIFKGWIFTADKVIPLPIDNVANAEREKQRLMSTAVNAIAILQDAVNLEMATQEEAELLLAWRKYRVLLNRVDASAAPDIEWPDLPELNI